MIKIYGEKYEKIIKEIAERTLEKFGNTESDAEVEITVCGEEEIKELNKEKRGIDKVTDVLSFQNLEKIKLPLNAEDYPTDINPEDGSVIIGEIFICEKKVSEQAEEYGHSEEREVAFLTCHGMLHLLGFDHNDKKSEEEMKELVGDFKTNPMSLTSRLADRLHAFDEAVGMFQPIEVTGNVLAKMSDQCRTTRLTRGDPTQDVVVDRPVAGKSCLERHRRFREQTASVCRKPLEQGLHGKRSVSKQRLHGALHAAREGVKRQQLVSADSGTSILKDRLQQRGRKS